jgi:hypothetical protein
MLKGANQSRRKVTWRVALVLVTLMLGSLLVLVITNVKAKALNFADPAFLAQWQRADKPVQDGSANRSWTWGPTFSEGKTEPYAETTGGQRQVQYFDKARMEINNPNAPRTDKYFVTNGLLVTEMINGKIQVGDNSFTNSTSGSSTIPVAGDPDNNPVALTYTSFAPVASIGGGKRASNQVGQLVANTLSKDGIAGQNPATGGYGVINANYEETLGHNIPNVFWSFLNQQGSIYVNNGLSNGLILEWQVAAGLPLTEAYWSRSVVGGQEKDVLVQMYQRRVLTYTPSNNPAFRVEMGNVGQHYYKWRYLTQPAPTPTAASPTVAPIPTPTQAPVVSPGPANWSNPRQVQTVARPIIRVRPTDGEVWVVGENKGAGGIFASGSLSNFGTVLNLEPGGGGGEKVQADFDTDGNLHVVWQAGTSIGLQTFYARVNRNSKQDWKRNLGDELAHSASGLPGISFNPANKMLYLVHEETPQTVVFYESADEGNTWTNRHVIASGNATQTSAKVVGDAQGNVHVIWNRQSNGAADLFGVDRIGNNWTNPYNITQYNGSWNVPPGSLSIGPNGDAYLTWISPGNNSAGIGFARYDAASKQWKGRRDNVSNTSSGFGSFKSTNITTSSNGSIWIGFSLDNQDNTGNSGAYYLVSNDNGANWSGVQRIFRRENADAGNITSFGGNLYFVGTYNRETFYSFRGQ